MENDLIHRPYGDITLQVAGGFWIECGEPMYPKLWRGPCDPPTMGECHTDIYAPLQIANHFNGTQVLI